MINNALCRRPHGGLGAEPRGRRGISAKPRWATKEGPWVFKTPPLHTRALVRLCSALVLGAPASFQDPFPPMPLPRRALLRTGGRRPRALRGAAHMYVHIPKYNYIYLSICLSVYLYLSLSIYIYIYIIIYVGPTFAGGASLSWDPGSASSAF